MKVTNICRKLAQTLAAAGLLAVSNADAAPLNTNLVVNPSFESVDPGIELTDDHAVLVTGGWLAAVGGGGVGAYTYSQGFDNGTDPPGSGSYYYTFPANPSPATQVIDLSTGESASLIATGNALFGTSSYFSNYLSQGDYGRLTVTFKNSGGTTLGSPVVVNSNAGLSGGVLNWSQFSTDGTVPVGTATATVELVGIRFDGTTNLRFREGYFDLVDFRVLNAPPPVGLTLTVNRATGNLTIGTEATGSPVNITEYSIESAFEGLNPANANWLSITDNYDAGNPGPNQVDPNSNWVEVTDPAAHDNLNEEDSNPNGATLTVGRTINLGNAWTKSYDEDLVFRYTANGQVLTGTVSYLGNGGQPFEYGDLSFNGSIGLEDYLILANNQHVDLTGKSFAEAYQLGDLTGNLANNHVDFVEFKTLYNQANGAGSFEAMLAGIPEPSSSAIVFVAGFFGLLIKRRTARDAVS